MDSNQVILNQLLQNLEKAVIVNKIVTSKSKPGSLKKSLQKQLQGYLRHQQKITAELTSNNYPVNKLAKWKQALFNVEQHILLWRKVKETQIASKVITNSNNGIIHATRSIKSNKLTDEKTQALANSLIAFEQQNIQNFKEYL